jgi:transposase
LVKSHISSLRAAHHCRHLIEDSALYTAEIIQALSEEGQYFITRVPQKIIEAKELLYHLDKLAFHDLTNRYRGAKADSDYAGVKQRWLVVHSQQANYRELKTLHK